MKIKVTLGHIAKAKQECAKNEALRSMSCPIAQALHDQGFPYASVGVGTGIMLRPSTGESIKHSEQSRGFVIAFDSDLPVFPCEFDLPLEPFLKPNEKHAHGA